MKLNRVMKVIGGVSCLAGSLVSTAWAAEHGEGHVAEFSSTFPFWTNFIVYLVALYLLFRKKLPAGWLARSESIRDLVNKGARELEEAKALRVDAERKLSQAGTEIAKISADIAKDTEREAAQIVADSKEKAARLKAQAELLAQSEQRATEIAIKRELADLVVKKASERLQKAGSVESDKARRQAALNGVRGLIEQ